MASNNSDENKSWAQKAFEAVEQAAARKEREIPESIKVPGLPVAVQPSEYEAPSGGGVWGDVAKGLYDTAMSDYNRLKTMYTDQTEEAKKIRSTWETAPTVSIKNGRLKLSGSKDFLASPEAKQLRETMKGMQGSTYNTEDLNKQIESWNAVLAQMSEQYVNSLDTLNSMNAAIAQTVSGTTREDFQKYLTFSDLQKIGNSAAVGKQPDARKTKNKIFVGYEWDDEGNMVEKWVDAADFFNEFNDQSDDKKRSAYHSLITQANLGDVGAYSKLMYLQGGSQGGPANVDVDSTGTFFENILQGAEAGAAGVLQDIFDYAPILNLRTIGGNISNAAENADQRNFWDWAAAIMAPGLYADKYDTRAGLLKVYNDAVTDFNNLRDWSNTYTAELNPASTEIGRTVGDFAGGALRIAGDIYAFGKLGQLAADTKFAAMQIANQKFAGSSAFTPMGQIYIKKYGVRATDQVTPLANNGGVATMGRTLRDTTTVTPFGGIYVPTVFTKISPKFTQFLEEAALAFTEVQFARSASQFISEDGTTVLQFGAAKPAGTKRVWSDKGVASVVEPMTQAQWSVEWGNPQTFTSGSNIRSAWDTFSKSAGSTVSDSKVLSNTINFSRSYELLKSLRNKDTILGISKGLQTAQALSNLVGFAAMRNVDEYFQRVEAGEDVGDMADYIITHTAEDAVWGGLIMKAGGMMKFFKRGADASAKPTVEYVQEVYDGMKNSQSGWYMPGTYASSRFMLGPGELTESEVSDITSTLSTVMTTNGEAIVGFSGELGGVSAVPGTNIKEAGKALGVYSPSKITRLSVQPTNGGAYLIREETNLDTNVKVETRKFYTDIEEATKAAGAEAVPKTSPKTLENSDQVNNAKVAPLTIDGKAPDVMPDGVSQVRVQPGIVYYGPDEMVDAVVNLAADSGWHETNLDRLYQDYERFVQEAQAQQGAIEHMSEAPAVPKEMYGTDIDGLLRLAAWAKVNGCTLIPMKSAAVTGATHTYKTFKMEDKFISELVQKYNLPEINPSSLLVNSRGEINGEYWGKDYNGTLQYALSQPVAPMTGDYSASATQEQNDIVDVFAVLEMLYNNEPYNGLALSNKNPEKVLSYMRGFGENAFKNEARHAIELSHLTWGLSKEDIYKMIEEYARRAVENIRYMVWAEGSGPETAEAQIVKNLKDIVDRGYDKFVDLVAPADDKAISDFGAEVFNPDKMLVKFAAGDGTPINTDIVVPVRRVDGGLIYSEGATQVNADRDATRSNKPRIGGDTIIAHIPAGTKVARTDSRDENNSIIRIGEYNASDWGFDTSNGVEERDTPNGKELFVKKEGGYPHNPEQFEYNLADYSIYNRGKTEGFENLAKDVLSPIQSTVDLNKKQRDSRKENRDAKTLYDVTEPGGPVNRLNYYLRRSAKRGEIPKDSISARVNEAYDILDRARQEGPGEEFEYGDYWSTDRTLMWPERAEELHDALGRILLAEGASHDANRTDLDPGSNILIEGSGLGEILRKANAKRSIRRFESEEGEDSAMVKNAMQIYGLTEDDLATRNSLDRYVDDVNEILDMVEAYSVRLSENRAGVLPDKMDRDSEEDALFEELKTKLENLAIEYGDNPEFPDGYSIWFQPIANGAGEVGSHKVKANMAWDLRGMTESGNSINTSDGIKMKVGDLEVGDHVIWPSLDFGSFNLSTPNRYATPYVNDTDERYFILTGSPKGTGLFFFGDPKNFGKYDNDNHLHVQDGGAAVHPLNMGATIVSIRQLGPKTKLIIQIRDNANGKPYSGPIDGQGGGVYRSKGRVQVRQDDKTVVKEYQNRFVGTEYGVPKAYFPDATNALEWAAQSNIRAVHELSDEPMTLDRPPVTTETLDEPLLLESGASAEGHLERLTGLLQSMQEMEDSDINYSYGIIDALKQMRGIYGQVSANVNLTDIYARYAQSIYEGEEIKLTPDERRALKPLTDALDALGHYFDPSGKSLTKEFYLPTGAATRNKVSIEEALLGEDEIVDAAMPLDGGLEEILIDADRIGDSGFWQKRTGELFMDSEGNFTMSKAAPLEDNLIAYTVSALTRGPHKLTLAVNNEVARSKANPNRTQITAKQARAMLQEADTLRTKTRSYQLGTHKDAEKIAKLKMDYTGDESTVDQALREKNYAKKLNYTRALNTLSQKGGFNQFLDIHPIKGSATRFGVGPYKGTANIRRKMSEINITGTMYKFDHGHWENYGFGIEPSQANIKKYGVFKDGGGAVNLGEILNLNFESSQRALDFYGGIKENIKNYAAGDGEALQVQLDEFARKHFPLHTNISSFSAKLMKEFGKNLYANNNDVVAAEAANVDSVEKWLRTGALICFNNAIQMGDIQNLDKRTIEALDDAAAYLLVGAPVKRSAAINFVQRWSVDSALGLNAKLVIGNVGSEIFTRLPGYVGTPATIAAFVKALNPAEFRRVRNILKDLPLHFDDSNSAIARRVYNRVSDAVGKAEDVALTPLTWSELFKNVVYYLAGERNAIKSGITDPVEVGQSALNFVNEHAIAGGRGTTPGVAESSLGRVLFIFKTFTVRNFDDFLDFVKKASHGRSGDNYWDKKYEKRHKGDDKDTIDLKIAARVIGGRAFRSYIFWLFVGSYFGKTFLDALGGDPTGILEGGYDRGLYDDPDTQEYEGMTDFDNFINNIPAGFILGALQDLYFAARRRGIEAKQFFGIDIFNDPRLQKELSNKLPLGVAKNRLGDMLSLLDRGYSFSSTGRKTYAAPDTVWDLTKGFLFGKSTTANSLAYGKYRYGTVNIWGDISSGDWMDFAINANPLTNIFGGSAQFDTTRKDYTGVFDGSWNDIATMQLIVRDFRARNEQIIANFQENKYKWTGEYKNLTDAEKLAKAKDQREKDIDKFTDDVQRAVDAFTKAGNTLSDSQITTMMNLFDFHEGEEDDEWNSSYARERYVEAGLPDYSALGIKRVEKKTDEGTEEETQNILDRSLILKNAQQGFYGSSKEAANAIKDALKDFGSTYKAYNTRVKALNNKYFEARNKNKKSAETKKLSQDLEKLQNEYLDKLFDKIAPVIDQYGTALVGTYDGADVLSEYMGNMIPYSSIKEYGQTYSSGNDVVYGQLAEWLQKRLGRNAPTAPSDKEVTSGISDIKKLIDQGKTAAAKSKARAILEKIGRGSLGARRDDVETLRSYVYD